MLGLHCFKDFSSVVVSRGYFLGEVLGLFNAVASLVASLIAQLVKNPPAMQETPVSIPGLGRSSGEGIGYPLQYSWASFVAQLVRNPPAIWETWV